MKHSFAVIVIIFRTRYEFRNFLEIESLEFFRNVGTNV